MSLSHKTSFSLFMCSSRFVRRLRFQAIPICALCASSSAIAAVKLLHLVESDIKKRCNAYALNNRITKELDNSYFSFHSNT